MAVLLPAIGVHAQVVERERPSEWSQLVEGARFMDRFLPMPKGETIEGVWGIDALQRRYVDNGIESPETSFWGGNILRTSDGKYHLYVCGWPEDSPKGHMFWRNSTVFHAVCDNSVGPFKIENLSPYQQITDSRVYPAVEGRFEDPVVWRDSLQYHLIVNDWLGRIAFYQRSKDGVHWVTEQGEAYVPGVSFHPDGEIEPWFKYERLKILQDEYGRAVQANFAVIDTLKWEDLPNDRHSSKNISIPLNKGLLLEVLNKKEITASTKHIELRIKAEDGFYPQTDLDVESLRFGSYTEVNFGRGCKVVKSRVDGKDLIVTFKGKGSGITSDEFAPKLIGMASVGKLMPYETQIVAITDISQPLNPEAIYEVVFQIDGKEIERNKFEYIEKK